MLTPAGLVLVLALFLAFAGWAGIIAGRAVSSESDPREAAGNVLLLALLFAFVALLALEFVLPQLEELLLRF